MFEDAHLDASYEDRFSGWEEITEDYSNECRNVACGEDAVEDDGFCGDDCRDLIMADSDFYTGPTYTEWDD